MKYTITFNEGHRKYSTLTIDRHWDQVVEVTKGESITLGLPVTVSQVSGETASISGEPEISERKTITAPDVVGPCVFVLTNPLGEQARLRMMVCDPECIDRIVPQLHTIGHGGEAATRARAYSVLRSICQHLKTDARGFDGTVSSLDTVNLVQFGA